MHAINYESPKTVADAVKLLAAHGEKEVSLGLRKTGEVLGEMVMLREYRHEWSARASAKSELLFIPRSVIGPIVAQISPHASRPGAPSIAGCFVPPRKGM